MLDRRWPDTAKDDPAFGIKNERYVSSGISDLPVLLWPSVAESFIITLDLGILRVLWDSNLIFCKLGDY